MVKSRLAASCLGGLGLLSCGAPASTAQTPPPVAPAQGPAAPPVGASIGMTKAVPALGKLGALAAGEIYVYQGAGAPARGKADAARAQGLLDVDLSDGWAPFIFQDASGPGDEPKPNGYRKTFVDLANDRVNADGLTLRKGEHNYLEAFGIPATLSVLATRIEDDLGKDCYGKLDLASLKAYTGNVGYLDRDRSRRDFAEATSDWAWLNKQIDTYDTTLEKMRAEPKTRGRVERALRGQERLKAVRAVQARLQCEGMLSPRSRFTDGTYDLPTHEALAAWERKNDIFGWGFLGGETLEALQRPQMQLHFDTFKRILAERVAAAAAIVEDGSTAGWKKPPSYKDADGIEHPVPNLIGDHVDALLHALGVESPEDMVAFLRAHGGGLASLHVGFHAPALPPYYGPEMALSVEIDRGDVWYDFPWDKDGKPIQQPRERYPHLTLFCTWQGQRIPLVWWRTTIGSWRSEVQADGKVYMKYKNSDVGPRVWRHIVAGPTWVPPDGTPAKDLLTRKVLDRDKGPETVVNTDVMGPGFGSAYGLVMAIHVEKKRNGWFDNQIRTHGSVDYTSIARRFSHGCHRLVNNRAVRLFDFVLRHRKFDRLGNQPLNIRKKLVVDGVDYQYELKTRGYYYELPEPVPVMVTEGRIRGLVKKPVTAFVPKPGVDYGAGEPAVETAPTLGP